MRRMAFTITYAFYNQKWALIDDTALCSSRFCSPSTYLDNHCNMNIISCRISGKNRNWAIEQTMRDVSHFWTKFSQAFYSYIEQRFRFSCRTQSEDRNRKKFNSQFFQYTASEKKRTLIFKGSLSYALGEKKLDFRFLKSCFLFLLKHSHTNLN